MESREESSVTKNGNAFVWLVIWTDRNGHQRIMMCVSAQAMKKSTQ